MKTYTLEELHLAQAKGCRIEILVDGVWMELKNPEFKEPDDVCRIHPSDEWKARLPRLREGAEWHRNDFTNEMLDGGFRPLLLKENGEGQQLVHGLGWMDFKGIDCPTRATHAHCRTTRPVPPEFLHSDELAKQTEAFTGGQKVRVDWHDPHGDGSFSGQGEFIRHLEKGDVGDELLKDGPHVVVKCTPDDSGSIFPLSAVKAIQQAEAAQVPDFGEPWQENLNLRGTIMDRNRIPVIDNVQSMKRAIICTNALAGVPDPAEFVRQAKEAKAVLEEMANMPEYDQDDAHRLRHKAKIALSKLKPFIP